MRLGAKFIPLNEQNYIRYPFWGQYRENKCDWAQLFSLASALGGGLRRDGFGCWRTNGRKNALAQNRRDGKPPPLL